MRRGASTAVHICPRLQVFTGWVFRLGFRNLSSHFPVTVGDLLLGYTGGGSRDLETTQPEILRQLDSQVRGNWLFPVPVYLLPVNRAIACGHTWPG